MLQNAQCRIMLEISCTVHRSILSEEDSLTSEVEERVKEGRKITRNSTEVKKTVHDGVLLAAMLW